MKIFLAFVLFTLLRFDCYGQIKGDYVWQLGFYSHPQNHDSPRSLEIKFNDQVRIIDTLYRPMEFSFFNTSISNDFGELQLYSNGCQIRDGHHRFIEGSNYLNPGSVDDDWCILGRAGYPISEGGIFLQFLNGNLTILLHQRLIIKGNPTEVPVDKLFYTSLTRIDSSFEIIEKSIPLIIDTLTTGNLEATRSYSSDSWWVLQGQRDSNGYYSIKIDSGNIDTIFLQNIGDPTLKIGEASGQVAFSPDGRLYARYTPLDDLFLFNFDRNNGTLSNYRKIHVADSGDLGGIAFSPNSRFLYVNSKIDMYQFDMWASDIEKSKIHLGHYDGYVSSFPTTFFHMQLGPDCRIYVLPPNGVDVMHVIEYPDEKGLACGFEQHSIRLPYNNTISLPNFPNYRLDIAEPCDPSITTFLQDEKISRLNLEIYPNPANSMIQISANNNIEIRGPVKVVIYNLLAQEILTSELDMSSGVAILNIETLPNGYYHLTMVADHQYYTGAFVKTE